MKKFIRIKDLIDTTGLSKSSIYQFISDGEFPSQIKLGARSVAWDSEEINEWMNERIAVSRPTTNCVAFSKGVSHVS
jgi:prophage regulatory protein